MFETIKQQLSRVLSSVRNTVSLPEQFLRYGNRKTMYPDWSEVMMTDADHYTGYSYAAITKRARAVARVASQFITSDQPTETDKSKDYMHPYLPMIQESRIFSENFFWQTISTFLDLEGVFYLMVIRNPDGSKNPNGSKDLGAPQMFKLLNPYNIQRVMKKDTLEVGGYIEHRKGFQREIPAELIIPIWELNPFDEDKPFAMTDASRESSYTLKSSGDYTRHALRNNVDAPGIITTDVIMESEKFENFVARMKDHTKGEPVFGNGAGAVKWTPMNFDVSKAALKDITEINRETLFAVTGMSKTMMGIEQSGTTRETSNVQKDLFIENEIVPRINLVMDALNLDYKTRYATDYEKNKGTLGLLNPIESDQDIAALKVTNKTANYDLYKQLVDDGYTEDIASQFVAGEIDLEKLGKPKNPPKVQPVMPGLPGTQPLGTPAIQPKGKKKQGIQLNEIALGLVQDQESMLQNAIVNADGRLAVMAVNRIPKLVKNAAGVEDTDIGPEEGFITPSQKKSIVNELILVLTAFYGIVSLLQAKETIKDRSEEFGGNAQYLMDKITKEGINRVAEKAAESHVDTVSADLYNTAKEAALKGKSQAEIISELKVKYSHDVTENRAKVVARSETNRAFTMAQYDADRQFIAQNDLGSRAFKQYETRSANPCPFCLSVVGQGLIPFDEPFVKKGDSVTAKVDGKEVSFNVNYESVFAGNLHPNCSCDYRLVILPEKQKK